MELILNGLDCAHCAEEIRSRVEKLESVEKAEMNFMAKKLTVSEKHGSANVYEDVKKIIAEVEPDVTVEIKHTSAKKTEYILEDLDCAHCAEEIRAAVEKLPDVKSAEMNFMAKKLTVEADRNVTETIKKIVSELEPDVTVKLNDEVSAKKSEDTEEEHEGSGKVMIIRIVSAVVLAAAGFIVGSVSDADIVKTVLMVAAYLIAGYDVLLRAVKNIFKGRVFDENFLMTIASVGAMLIGEASEGAAVMILYQIGEYFQNYAVERSRKSISGLMELRPDSAGIRDTDENGNMIIRQVSPESISIGDVIVVSAGERVPLDGELISADCSADTSALTGESVPRTFRTGDEVMSGVINLSGVMELRVTKKYGESTVSRILEMVENAGARKAPSENFITKFARYYTPCVVIAAILLAVIPMMIDGAFSADKIYPALEFLVVSCPCALVISVPLSYFGGIGGASKKGILIKGGSVMDILRKADTAVFDKTGTLTEGVFDVTKIYPEENADKILRLCAAAESYSNHPTAVSVKRAYERKGGTSDIANVTSEELSGMGVKANYDGSEILAGNKRLMDKFGIQCENPDSAGTVIHVAENGKYLGYILISDRIKKRSAEAVAQLKSMGIKTVMLTGDREAAAKEIAAQAGIDRVYAGLMPGDKADILGKIKAEGSSGIIFAGDGINDAPVLMAADAGFAMGGIGSDAAIEAADAVIMDDDPSKIADAIAISKRTGGIVMQNIVFALAVKFIVMVLAALSIANMWAAVFADVGVSFIAVLNAMRAGKVK